jgi:hypothetical protein
MADTKNDEVTEIRREVNTKGGVAYEVILTEPVALTPPYLLSSPSKTFSIEKVEEKLKAAEEKRLSLIAKMVADLATKRTRAVMKREEKSNNFNSTHSKKSTTRKGRGH